MNAFLTLIFIFFIGSVAQAQDDKKEIKVATQTKGIVINLDEAVLKNDNGMARLYKFKNALVKKELSFTTKNNRAKLA
ncbi:hypothetical protein U1E44_02905 [Arenibacter sp. GZD96]|uniref:hypothetical protein n=1 Tax=Aurantibrevibacter litoralis TaxID=3106030 RepID=UPI002AFEC04B|nr:hypothetical protein [Arenibacter sp. GZD-96]MEA1785030.1 hypothetical protein [Arenibacter sp. GZD-96]